MGNDDNNTKVKYLLVFLMFFDLASKKKVLMLASHGHYTKNKIQTRPVKTSFEHCTQGFCFC
jgi:hypothetical protein